MQFTYAASPARIVFGQGAIQRLEAEVAALGLERVLVLSTPEQAEAAQGICDALGSRAAGLFAGAAMHTPVEVTQVAMDAMQAAKADGVVSFGGGSTTGLGKAIAYRTDLPQVAIPTTYAGSEVTNILGQTEKGLKTTVRDARILPEVVVYDPDLTMSLPVGMSVTSGLNAMAHAAEALYASDRNPISTLMAAEGLRAFRDALPVLVRSPGDARARTDALYGAWLCGTVLGAVGMALHHKICHTLGGSFDLPHAPTHAIMLAHTIGYNGAAVPEPLKPVAELFGATPGVGLYDFAQSLGAPQSLAQLGFKREDIDRAAELATRTPYPNPRAVDLAGIRTLLEQAFEGQRPPF